MKIVRAFIFVFFLISNFAFGMVKEPFKFWSYEPNGKLLGSNERNEWLNKFLNLHSSTFPRLNAYSISDFQKAVQMCGIYYFIHACVNPAPVEREIRIGDQGNEFVQFFDRWIPGLLQKIETLDCALRKRVSQERENRKFRAKTQIVRLSKKDKIKCENIAKQLRDQLKSELKYDALFELSLWRATFECLSWFSFHATQEELKSMWANLVKNWSVLELENCDLASDVEVISFFECEENGVLQQEQCNPNLILLCLGGAATVAAVGGGSYAVFKLAQYVANEKKDVLVAENGIQVCREQNKLGGEYLPHLYGKQQIPADAVKAVFKVQENADKNWIVVK